MGWVAYFVVWQACTFYVCCMLEVWLICQNYSWVHCSAMCNEFVWCIHIMADIREMHTFCIWGLGVWVGWWGRGFGATQVHLLPYFQETSLLSGHVEAWDQGCHEISAFLFQSHFWPSCGNTGIKSIPICHGNLLSCEGYDIKTCRGSFYSLFKV